MSNEQAAEPRHRPRDRKQQILIVARELFVYRGYPNVTMAQIGERVGITAGALYRHFNNKTVLLEQVVEDTFAWVDVPVPQTNFADAIESILGVATASPFLADLWAHEVRFLPEPRLNELRRRISTWRGTIVAVLRTHRPDLDDDEALLMAWTVQSLMSCLARRAMHAPMSLRVAVVREAMYAVTSASLTGVAGSAPELPERSLEPVSVRERLLAAAFDQFTRRGYAETTLSSLGAAVQVTGPNLYGYFACKEDILRAVLERANHALWIGLDDALGKGASEEQALRLLIANYIARAGSWSRILEDPSGDDALDEAARGTQREYIAEWVALLTQVCQGLDSSQARARVQLTLFLISDLHGVSALRRNVGFREDLAQLAATVLFGRGDS